MGDEQFTTRRETSQQRFKPSTNQRLSYATQRAGVLFGSYRRGDANDPDAYVTSIAAVLSLYDFELIREVTDPRTGIQTTEKFASFMPNAGELKLHCEAKQSHSARLKNLASVPKPDFNMARLAPPVAPAGHCANVFVPADNGRYAALVEWSKTSDKRMWKFGKSSEGRDGIWVAHDVWERGVEQAGRWEKAASQYAKTNEDVDRRDMQQREPVSFE